MPEVKQYAQGTPSWGDLATTDVDAAAAKVEPAGGRDGGGVMPKNEQMKSLPSHWSVYFMVDDCDGTVDKAKSMNAQVIVPPTDMGPGRFAVMQDPQGAVFSVIKMEQPAA